MREPKRIPELLEALKALWYANPDLRFLQLMEYVRDEGRLGFYTEDDVTLERIQALLKE